MLASRSASAAPRSVPGAIGWATFLRNFFELVTLSRASTLATARLPAVRWSCKMPPSCRGGAERPPPAGAARVVSLALTSPITRRLVQGAPRPLCQCHAAAVGRLAPALGILSAERKAQHAARLGVSGPLLRPAQLAPQLVTRPALRACRVEPAVLLGIRE